ncbi:unnamed protein product [Closterium sp. NIES-54]
MGHRPRLPLFSPLPSLAFLLSLPSPFSSPFPRLSPLPSLAFLLSLPLPFSSPFPRLSPLPPSWPDPRAAANPCGS